MLTIEQEEIVNVSCKLQNEETIKINAFAGTGKTTTLLAVTKANQDTKFLYIAFNNSIVTEARKKFGNNVDIFTWHSLAINNIDMSNYKIRNEEYDLLTIQDTLGSKITLELVSDVMKLIKYYFNSDCVSIKEAALHMQSLRRTSLHSNIPFSEVSISSLLRFDY